MAKKDLRAQEHYINRELSWLEFNARVLQEAQSPTVPLIERLKFLAIVSTNLDEFFMVRVAGLMQQRAANIRKRDMSGITPLQQLKAISERAHRMVREQSDALRAVRDELAFHNFRLLDRHDWTPEQGQFLRGYFAEDVLPVLTPLAVEELDPMPLIPGASLHIAALLH